MRLVLDAGNSTLAAALADATSLRAVARVPAAAASDVSSLQAALAEAFEWRDAWPAIESVGLASVVPDATASVVEMTRRRGLPLVLATPGAVGIPIRVASPERVGADRLANALAAVRLHGAPAIVVDAGTAITWECVDGDGAFVGGAIAPGVSLALEALEERTALLPHVSLAMPATAIATDTVAAIRSGTVLGYQALVEGLTGRIRAELAAASDRELSEVRTILTGGLAASPWGEALAGFDVRDPDLTLRGLALLVDAAGAEDAPGAAAAGAASDPAGARGTAARASHARAEGGTVAGRRGLTVPR